MNTQGPHTPPDDDDIVLEPGAGGHEEALYLTPGGKVDAEALRAAFEKSGVEPGAEPGEGDDERALPRVVFRLKRDLNKRLDKFLVDRVTFMSRTQLQRVIDEGGVLVNGRIPKASTCVRAGDEVSVLIPPPPSTEILPENIPLDVLYEDRHLIVINKHPGIITHPARSHNKGTLINALAYRFRNTGGQLSSVGKDFARPGVVHRLDRDTSGVMLFAKDDEAHWKLGHQFEYRTVEKRYMAVVHGKPEPLSDSVELPIGPHPSREKGYREKYVVRHDEQGKPALTIYRTREVYRLHERAVGDQHFALVELELRTGRTHQIRVHLSTLGWPIVADDMYGGRAFSASPDGPPIIERQALHATLLGFTHPITNERMVFTAPFRGDMAALVGELRRASGAALITPPAQGSIIDLAKL